MSQTSTRAAKWQPIALAAVAFVIGMNPSAVNAQTVVRGQGVDDRLRPDYDPLGIGVGSFQLYPQLDVAARATDNFRATNEDRQGDVYMVLAPALRFDSNWARHDLSGGAYFSQSVHAELPSEDVSQYGASLRGALDVSRDSQLRISGNADHKVESRTALGSLQGTATPVNYNVFVGSISGSQTIDRLVLNATVAAEQLDFFDAIAPDGSIIDQDFRDVLTIRAGGSAQYEIRSGLGLIVSGQYVDARFNNRPTNPTTEVFRDSTGFDLLGGVSLELSSLIFGQIQFGYISRQYVDPRLKDVSGPSFQADLLWNVTSLTSLRLGGARTVEDTSSTQFAGNTRTAVNFSVDHELYRYVIVSADIAVSHFSANGPGPSGDEFGIGVETEYLINRRWSLTGSVRYAQRTSDDDNLRFHATTVAILAQLAF